MDEPQAATTAGNPPVLGNRLVGADTNIAKAKQSELERFANALSYQRELLNRLASRLDWVSNRNSKPSDGTERDAPPHISTLIDIVANNNNELEQIINEIVL
jgi:hypothetical protein